MRVVQLTDIHYGAAPSPIDGRDAGVSLRQVLDHVAAHHGPPDLYVATGDLTDDGSTASALGLGAVLDALDAPVHCVAGNHDSGHTLAALVSRRVHAPTSTRHGNWLFCYVDTNGNGRMRDHHGALIDHPDRQHRASMGTIDPDDLAALDRTLASSDAPHAMIWLHHPPIMPPTFDDQAARSPYFHDLAAVLARHPAVHGVAAGHLHTGYTATHAGITYYGTTTTWLAMDFAARTLTPPGYRTFVFEPHGHVTSTAVLIDPPEGAGPHPLPDWVDRVLADHFGLTPQERA